jgi:ParB family chromosome partitioning protein
MKKADMAKEAQRLLGGTGWLPEPLRTPDAAAPTPPLAAMPGHSPLPAFLTDSAEGDGERAAAE